MTSSKGELDEILVQFGKKLAIVTGTANAGKFTEAQSNARTAQEEAKAALTTYIAREKTAAQLHQAFTDLEAMQNGDSDYEWVIENQRAEVERLDQRLKRIIAERGYKIGEK